MNILVTGAYGQLGQEVEKASKEKSNWNFIFTDRDNLDITDYEAVKSYCDKYDIDAIINCAAYTAVDRAESEEEAADKVNREATANLSKEAKRRDAKLIHISTDYVFDGKNYRPYREDDPTAPASAYGRTKLAGEKEMMDISPKNSIIIRTSWVYSSYGANFVKTMLRLSKERDSLGVIFDQIGTPTYAADLANAILDILPLIENDSVEIYHYSNEGVCSWYDFAIAIFQESEIELKVSPILTEAYPTPAKRPHYSILDKSKIKRDFGIEIPYWRESLKRCLSILKERE